MAVLPALRVRDLTLSFSGVTALAAVSFDVRPGSFAAVIGPNGAGKSTLFNILSGLYRPTAGTATYGDTPLTGRSPSGVGALGIARTFQNLLLVPTLTLRENILIGLHRRLGSAVPLSLVPLPAVARAERAARAAADALCDRLGIGQWAGLLPPQAPYGVRKLAELGRAIAAQPTLLLLDEPAAGLNSDERVELVRLLRELAGESGHTTIIVEHDFALVRALCDWVVVLDFGRRIAAGSPDVVASDPGVIAAYLGAPDVARVSLGA